MTQQEILEYNKRCAKFLGIELSELHKNEFETLIDRYTPLCAWSNASFAIDEDPSKTIWDYLKFHLDWNWIMELVEAIEKLGAEYCLGNKYFSISYTLSEGNWYAEETIVKSNIETKEAVVQAINQFLIWYEKQKES